MNRFKMILTFCAAAFLGCCCGSVGTSKASAQIPGGVRAAKGTPATDQVAEVCCAVAPANSLLQREAQTNSQPVDLDEK